MYYYFFIIVVTYLLSNLSKKYIYLHHLKVNIIKNKILNNETYQEISSSTLDINKLFNEKSLLYINMMFHDENNNIIF